MGFQIFLISGPYSSTSRIEWNTQSESEKPLRFKGAVPVDLYSVHFLQIYLILRYKTRGKITIKPTDPSWVVLMHYSRNYWRNLLSGILKLTLCLKYVKNSNLDDKVSFKKFSKTYTNKIILSCSCYCLFTLNNSGNATNAK